MTIAQRIGQAAASAETATRAGEFAALAKFIMASGGVSTAARAAETASRDGNLGPRLARILKSGLLNDISCGSLQKAAATAGTLAAFSDYSVIAEGFVNSLVNASALDTMLASMTPVPLQTGTLGAVSTGAQAFSVAEGSTKAISKLSLIGQQQNPQKAHCIVVVTQELAKASGANATALIGRELRNAVAVTTDTQFIATLIAGLPVATSAGPTSESVRADISNLLKAITTEQTSKLFIITTPLICKMWSMLTDSKGVSAFPDLGPLGGSINQIPVLVSEGVTAGNVVLVDASGIAAASGDLVLNEFREGMMQLDTTPDSRLRRQRTLSHYGN
jgi:HK97 family phage major capsid protein